MHLFLERGPEACNFGVKETPLKMYKVKKSQLIWQINILFQWRFGHVSSVYFQNLMMKKLSSKYYKKRIITRDNGNVQGLVQSQLKDVAIGITIN